MVRSNKRQSMPRTVEWEASTGEQFALANDVECHQNLMGHFSHATIVSASSEISLDGGQQPMSSFCCIHQETSHPKLAKLYDGERTMFHTDSKDFDMELNADRPSWFLSIEPGAELESYSNNMDLYDDFILYTRPYLCSEAMECTCSKSCDSTRSSSQWRSSADISYLDSSQSNFSHWRDGKVPCMGNCCQQQFHEAICPVAWTASWDPRSPTNDDASNADLDFKLSQRQAGTSEWILNDGDMIGWRSHSNSALWLSGLPGTGKSTLTSVVIRDLKANCAPGELVAFFMIDKDQQAISTTRAVLLAMLEQLLRRARLGVADADLRTILSDLASTQNHLTIQKMMLYLCKIRQSLRQDETLYLLVDGLDRLTDNSYEQKLMLHLLEYITRSDPSHEIKCFISSSIDFQIRSGEETFRIDLDAHPLLRQDMNQYVSWSLNISRPSFGPQDIVLLAEQILDLAAGSFLFVKLAVSAIQHGSSHEDESWIQFESMAPNLKLHEKTLDLIYGKMLAQIDECDHKASDALLRWMTYSCEPLQSGELLDAIYREAEIHIHATEIGRLSAGLLETYGDGVRFVHSSARRFLRDDPSKIRVKSSAEAHETIARICIDSLGTDRLLQTLDMASTSYSSIASNSKRTGLLRYAERHWMYHYRQGENNKSSYIAGLLHSRLGKGLECLALRSYRSWIRVAGLEFAGSTDLRHDTYYAGLVDTLLSVCSRFGFKRMAKLELDMGAHANFLANSKAPSPLMSAAMKGHSEIFRLLLEYGADVNLSSEAGYNPLHLAANHGRSDIVSLLLASGADIDYPSILGQTSLNIAAKQGYVGITQILLDRGADVNHSPSCGHTSLMLATKYNQIEVARLLLEKGANIDQASTFGETALVMAIHRNHPEAFRLLVEYGADLTKCTDRGNSPIMIAAQYGHLEIVRHLLDLGAGTMDLRTSNRALFIDALQNRRFDIIALLLKHDLDQAQIMETAPCLVASRELYLAARVFRPQNTFDSLLVIYELTPVNVTARLRTKPIVLNGKSVSKLEVPAALEFLGGRTTVRSIVRWFPGDHMYAVLREVAEDGIEDVVRLLVLAGNNIDMVDSVLSLSALLSGLKKE